MQWPEAVEAAAKGLGELASSDPRSLGVLCSGHLTNEDAFVAQEFARQVLGTDSIDNLGRALDGAATWGLEAAFCGVCRCPPLPSLERSDVILVLNSNLSWESPQAAAWIVRARDRGARVLLLDEVGWGFAAQSDTVLLHRPGMRSVALLMLLNALGGAPPRGDEQDPGALSSGLSADQIADLAAALSGAARPTFVFSASTIGRAQDAYLIGQITATLSSRSSRDAHVYAMPSTCNSCGVTQMGAAPTLAGPRRQGPGLAQMLSGDTRGLLLLDAGLEVLVGAEGLRKLREGAQFLCALAAYESDTTAVADLVLPVAGWGARGGTVTGGDGRIWGLSAQEDPGAGPSLATALADIARALGREMQPVGLADVRARIAATVDGYGRVEWDMVDEGLPGALGPRYSTAAEEADDLAAAPVEPAPVVGQAPERPVVLVVHRDDASWAFDPRARAAPLLERELAPRRAPYLTVGPETALAGKLRAGRTVAIRTAFGEAQAALRVHKGIPEGVAVVPWHCRDLVFGLCGPGEACPWTGTLSHGPVAAALGPPGG